MQIETNNQYIIIMAVIESYLQKGFDNLSDREERYLHELSKAVERWEMQEYK